MPTRLRSALVVLPGLNARAIEGDRASRWLRRGQVTQPRVSSLALRRVIGALALPLPGSGLAALRYWGQCGNRPDGWVCGADPLYLEARLDHLRVQSMPATTITDSEMQELLQYLQTHAEITDGDWAWLGSQSLYLSGTHGIRGVSDPATVYHGENPLAQWPGGATAADHNRLLGELQMLLHDMPLNARREQAGEWPINSLWMWGGGIAPQATRVDLPVLFADEPLLRGYWLCAGADLRGWPGRLESCIESGDESCVIVVPDDVAAGSPDSLDPLWDALQTGVVGRVQLLLEQGLVVDLKRGDNRRFWRKPSPLLRSDG